MNLKKTQHIKNDAKISALSLLSIVFLIFITNPAQMHIVFVLLVPILIAFSSFILCRLMLRLFFDLNAYQLKVASYTLAGSVLFVLLLGSLKQLGAQDFVLAALLAGGLGFYFMRSAQGPGSLQQD